MDEYLSSYGWHFSKKMCEWAVSMMKDREGRRMQMLKKEDIEASMNRAGVKLDNPKGYDAVYVFHMAKSDFMGSSIADEAHLAKYVKDYLDDPDGYDGIALTRFYADCLAKGVPVIWDDVL